MDGIVRVREENFLVTKGYGLKSMLEKVQNEANTGGCLLLPATPLDMLERPKLKQLPGSKPL